MRPPTPNAASPLLAEHGHRQLQNDAHYHGYRRKTTKLSCDHRIDQVRIHPTNNTITVSTPDENRAMVYLKIT
ncbi:hypothetical protein MTO96_032682 [Rhipicephalus appendiculatus]